MELTRHKTQAFCFLKMQRKHKQGESLRKPSKTQLLRKINIFPEFAVFVCWRGFCILCSFVAKYQTSDSQGLNTVFFKASCKQAREQHSGCLHFCWICMYFGWPDSGQSTIKHNVKTTNLETTRGVLALFQGGKVKVDHGGGGDHTYQAF